MSNLVNQECYLCKAKDALVRNYAYVRIFVCHACLWFYWLKTHPKDKKLKERNFTAREVAEVCP